LSLSALRLQTAENHARLEKSLDLFASVYTISQYTAHLVKLHSWLAPLEAALDNSPAVHALPLDWPNRRKLATLEKDLAYLGATRRPPLPAPPCRSAAEALGALYVLEGSMLGGQVICRHYADLLGLSPERGLAYFSGYGALTGPRWRAFLNVLESTFTQQADLTPEIIASALRTFESVERALLELKTSLA
jgi:heme oxygenase